MFHLCSSSLLTILLILVAALSFPDAAAAQSRKLRKDGNHRRRLGKSSKDSKCHKSENESCVGFQLTFSSIPIAEIDVGNGFSTLSYGNGRDESEFEFDGNINTVGTKATAVGSVVYQDGFVGIQDPNGDFFFGNPDYYFHQQCEVVRGYIGGNGGFFDPSPQGGDSPFTVPLKCDIFLHNGNGYSGFADLPDTIHLRGYTRGKINVFAQVVIDPFNGGSTTYEKEELRGVEDFFATVIGGTGRWAGSTGMAQVFTEGPVGQDFDAIPPSTEANGWLLDLFATVSPSYDQIFNVVNLPPPLDTEPVWINNPYDGMP